MAFPPVEEQLRLIRRGVEKIVPEEELAERLHRSRETNTPLRIKYGIDPTGIDLHLGHTVPMRKMRQFQQLGHQAVIIIGNYTALVGDPSGRDETRARLTPEQVEANAADYLAQLGKVIDLEKAEVVRNGDWFGRFQFADVLELCSKVTVAQLLTRDDFSKRFKAETPIFLHECLYPLMQAFDSVVVGADVELGGTEQLYSFMLARDLQKNPDICRLAERFQSPAVLQRRLPDGTFPPQIGVMSPILVGLDGVRRMGKSLGNYIGIGESAYEMMKKVMQLPDDCMRLFFELVTDVPLEEVERLLAGHPKEAKIALAKAIITEYHSAEEAEQAARRWQKEIGGKELPAEIPEVTIDPGGDESLAGVATFTKRDSAGNLLLRACDLYYFAKLCPSKSEARRLIQQGGARVGEERRKITDPDEEVAVFPGLLVWAGKKKVARVFPADVGQ